MSAQDFLEEKINGTKFRRDKLLKTASGVAFDSFKDAFNFSFDDLQAAANEGNQNAQFKYLLEEVYYKQKQQPTIEDLKETLRRWGKTLLLREFGLE